MEAKSKMPWQEAQSPEAETLRRKKLKSQLNQYESLSAQVEELKKLMAEKDALVGSKTVSAEGNKK